MHTARAVSNPALALVLAIGLAAASATAEEPAQVTVYKSPTCGCCGKWVEHLEENGFRVETKVVRDVRPVKVENGLPPQLASCHTAFVEGYLIEGHVPAADVKRLLAERPAVAGLAVPKMPIGSPGMEGPNPERYEVLSFDAFSRVEVFATHGP